MSCAQQVSSLFSATLNLRSQIHQVMLLSAFHSLWTILLTVVFTHSFLSNESTRVCVRRLGGRPQNRDNFDSRNKLQPGSSSDTQQRHNRDLNDFLHKEIGKLCILRPVILKTAKL